MEEKNIQLYGGSVIEQGVQASVLLPFIEEEVKDGDVVFLIGENEEIVGTALVDDLSVHTFAMVHNKQLADNVHPEMRHWANAFAFLCSKHEGFSQLEKVTIIRLTPEATE